jgi:hypothetical protein
MANTLERVVIMGIDLGLAMVRGLLENLWFGGLVLGLCLLISVLKLPAIFLLHVVLLLVGGLLLMMLIS